MYKVLIVDDARMERYLLRQLQSWESCGFVIEDEAGSGKEALIKLSSKSFDLVITDIRMPGMDGIELTSEIKDRNIDVCLILLSTYNDFEYAKQGIRFGVFDYMSKPVDNGALSEVLERVRRHLAGIERQQTKANEDNFRFYFPMNQERKLVDLILAGNPEVLDVTSAICIEIFNLAGQDLAKTGILLKKVTLNLSEELNSVFPWLGTLEEIDFNVDLTHAESIKEMSTEFSSGMSNMLEIIKKYELHNPESIVRKTCQYVMEHVEEDMTLNNIANEVHISANYVSKLFKQKTGSSFTDYVIKVKMEHAKYLLRTGEYKNYEVSEKLGYSRPDYFCRLFKDYTGYTPIDFKKMETK